MGEEEEEKERRRHWAYFAFRSLQLCFLGEEPLNLWWDSSGDITAWGGRAMP